MALDAREPGPCLPFSRLELIADDLYGVIPGNSEERVRWLRTFLREEVDRRSRERAGRHANAHAQLDRKIERWNGN